MTSSFSMTAQCCLPYLRDSSMLSSFFLTALSCRPFLRYSSMLSYSLVPTLCWRLVLWRLHSVATSVTAQCRRYSWRHLNSAIALEPNVVFIFWLEIRYIIFQKTVSTVDTTYGEFLIGKRILRYFNYSHFHLINFSKMSSLDWLCPMENKVPFQ